MYSAVIQANQDGKKEKYPKRIEGQAEIISINQARRGAGLPELICRQRECLVCGKGFQSLDASHRVCDNCRPKWEKKRDQIEKAFIDIEHSETFTFQDVEELSLFEGVS